MKRPLIHHITSPISANIQANATYACGGTPMMTLDSQEFEDLYQHVDGLLINLGMPSNQAYDAMTKAIQLAKIKGIPIVLDCVGTHISSRRRAFACQMIQMGPPKLIKGNLPEIISLFNDLGTYSQVNSGESFNGLDARGKLSQDTFRLIQKAMSDVCPDSYVLITGESDVILSAHHHKTIHGNPLPLVQTYTGLGCLLGSLLATRLVISGENLETLTVATHAYKKTLTDLIHRNSPAISFYDYLIHQLRKDYSYESKI